MEECQVALQWSYCSREITAGQECQVTLHYGSQFTVFISNDYGKKNTKAYTKINKQSRFVSHIIKGKGRIDKDN